MYMQILQILLVPLVFVFIAYYVGSKGGSKAGYLSFASLAYSTLLTLLLAWQGGGQEFYDWRPIGLFGLNADGLSIPILFTIALLSTLVSLYSIPYMAHIIGDQKKQFGLYYALLLLYSVGMMGAVLATNLIEFYLFFELMLIPSYFLIARWGYGDRDRISFMYFMWTHGGALAFLAGILWVGYLSGLIFDMTKIAATSIPEIYRLSIVGLMVVGLLVKMAAFGLHIWLPHAHAEAPTPISALLSPAMIGIGAYALVRILIFLLPSAYKEISLALSVWGLITMIYGGWMALNQDDIKRLLAYSSISQMGYIIFGLSSAYYIGVSGAIFQYVSHGMGKAILFMAVGSVILQTHGIRSISKLGGLASILPITATAALIGFLTIIGVPPISGFQSEWMIFYGSFAGAITIESTLKIIISAAALISTPLTAGYTLLAMKKIFYGRTPEHLQDVREASKTITIPLLFLAFLTILLGIYPDLINERIIHFMENILDS